MKIKLEHVTRIEGHASLTVMLAEGKVYDARLRYEEGARLFEGLLQGQRFYDAPSITSRICGVCPSVHNVTALKAVEAILGVQPGPVTQRLRRLMILAQWLQSHSLHAFFLALPDFLGAESALALAATHPREVAAALRLKKLGNDMVFAIGGRSVHPITTRVGGFSRVPPAKQLQKLRDRLAGDLPEAVRMARLLGDLGVPEFSRTTTYLALSDPDGYAYFDGEVCSSEGFCGTADDFCHTLKEEVRPGAAAKAGSLGGKGYFSGALARMNLSGDRLGGEARAVVDASGFTFPNHNTFLNTFCQTVEIVFALEKSIELMEELLSADPGAEPDAMPDFTVRAGSATGATEAPRGTLYHFYRLDEEGIIRDDNIITPTAQNLTNIEEDIKQFVGERLDWEPTRLVEGIECLVRAYDPCVSCATH